MAHIVWLTGAVTAIMGIAVLFKPLWMRQVITFIRKGKLVYLSAGSKTVLGILFLVLARSCRVPWVIITLGILMAFGPIFFCFMPFSKIQACLNWWIARPVWIYRLWGIAAVLFGGLIIYTGMPK